MNKAMVLRVDSSAIEELSDKRFELFCDSLFAKFTAMQHLGLLNCIDFNVMQDMWVNSIIDLSREEPYKTVYYVMIDKKNRIEDGLSLAIVQHEFGLFGRLKNMRLREFYALNWNYEEAYERMKRYLKRNYDYTTTTILHKEAYQRREHMTMGMLESIY